MNAHSSLDSSKASSIRRDRILGALELLEALAMLALLVLATMTPQKWPLLVRAGSYLFMAYFAGKLLWRAARAVRRRSARPSRTSVSGDG